MRVSVMLRTATALGLAAVAWGAPRVVSAGTHTDEELGYSIQVPQGWRAIPIAAEEQYVVAKWMCDREYADKTEGWGHRPDLKVILFDPKAKKTAEVKEEGEGISRITVHNPYRTFKDWVKSEGTGGRYISKEEEIVVGGLPTTWYEVAYEKLTVPRHGLAFVYHAEDIDYCVTTEVLEQHWKNLSPALVRALKSFKTFPRKGSVKRETTGDDHVLLRGDMAKLPPQERYTKRLSEFERRLALATERLPKGWEVKRSKNYVALTHADGKFTTMILEQAEAVRAWADENLAFFGTGIPGPMILRVCKDSAEESAFRDLSSRSSGWVQEIVLSKNDGFWGLGHVAGEIFDGWLADKNPRLEYSLPPWISQGIREWIGSAYVKGGKLEFRTDADLSVALKVAAKEGTLIPPQDLVRLSFQQLLERDGFGSGDGPPIPVTGFGRRTSAMQQAAGFIRYLLDGPGKTKPKTKTLLETYVAHLDAIVEAEDAKPAAAGAPTTEAKTEEEEEERFKNRQSYWKDHEKDLLKAVYDRAFADWSAADWSALEKSYRSFAD